MGYFYDTFMLICAIFQAFTSPIHCNCMQKGSTSKLFKMSFCVPWKKSQMEFGKT